MSKSRASEFSAEIATKLSVESLMRGMGLRHWNSPWFLPICQTRKQGPVKYGFASLPAAFVNDLHVVDGDLPNPKLPIIPGHEIVGRIDQIGTNVDTLRPGMRVGIPWLGFTCGICPYCRQGDENLATIRNSQGTRAMVATRPTWSRIFGLYSHTCDGNDVETAPLLCAGLIGWRSLRMSGEGKRIGLYGFGAAAHIVAQVARWQGRDVCAFTRPGDNAAQQFAVKLGAIWSGGSDELPSELLDCAVIYAPVGALVPAALRSVRKGGRVVCAGIHMSDIPAFPYRLLWEERQIVSVANLTRHDALEFFGIVPKIGIVTETVSYPFAQANQALSDLREGHLQGAAVLVP